MMILVRLGVGIFILYMLSIFAGVTESPYFSRLWKEPKWESMSAVTEPVSIADTPVITSDSKTQFPLSGITGDTPYFVMFYGDWCGICRKKMPYFLEKAAAFKQAGVPVLLVGDRRSRVDAWKRWAKKDTDLSAVTSVIDSSGIIFPKLNLYAVPSYGLINSSEELTAVFRFVSPHADDLVPSVKSLAELID